MKLGFICPNAPGHLNPMTTLARELQARKYDVVFLYAPTANGLPAVPGPEEDQVKKMLREVSALHGEDALSVGIRSLLAQTDGILKSLPEIVRANRVDALILDTTQRYVELGAMHLDIPYVHVSVALHFDYFQSKYNRVTQARRQLGSAFKPFVYSAAFDKGFSPASVVLDAPIVLDETGMEQAWRPKEDEDTFYGPVQVHFDLGLEVRRGEIVSLLGGNASGKSTTMKIILGLVRPRSGVVRFDGAAITGLPTPQIIRRGIGSVPEARRLFATMTVRENLLMGAYVRSDRAGVAEDYEAMLELFPRVRQRLAQPAFHRRFLASHRQPPRRPHLMCARLQPDLFPPHPSTIPSLDLSFRDRRPTGKALCSTHPARS